MGKDVCWSAKIKEREIDEKVSVVSRVVEIGRTIGVKMEVWRVELIVARNRRHRESAILPYLIHCFFSSCTTALRLYAYNSVVTHLAWCNEGPESYEDESLHARVMHSL